jgi:hypothetical protein
MALDPMVISAYYLHNKIILDNLANVSSYSEQIWKDEIPWWLQVQLMQSTWGYITWESQNT